MKTPPLQTGPVNEGTSDLIDRLARDAKPVHRLARPGWRAAVWLGLAGVLGVGLASRADLAAVTARLASHADMWLTVAGSVATAVTAALATVMVALPDRDARWALLPIPPLLLWLGASGLGCVRTDLAELWHPASFGIATGDCLPFILRFSLVLGLPLALLLWRTRPLRPGLVAWLGGLATASAAASLLWLDHPFDAGLVDFLVHMVAVGLVVLVCRGAALLLPD